MERDAKKKLSAADLAVYASTKGQHHKRKKLRDLFINNGGNLSAAMHLFSVDEDTFVIKPQCATAPLSCVPMTPLVHNLCLPFCAVVHCWAVLGCAAVICWAVLLGCVVLGCVAVLC